MLARGEVDDEIDALATESYGMLSAALLNSQLPGLNHLPLGSRRAIWSLIEDPMVAGFIVRRYLHPKHLLHSPSSLSQAKKPRDDFYCFTTFSK